MAQQRQRPREQQPQGQETVYQAETPDGFQVSVPESRLEAWAAAQERGGRLNRSERQVRDRIVSMLYKSRR